MNAKRFFDVFVAVILLFITLPILLFAMLAICINSEGSPLLKQIREGKNRKEFLCYKLRTMYLNAPLDGSHNVGQHYISSVGVILRKMKIDELPQLVNVLKGDMSMVGPRPCLPTQLDVIFHREQRSIFNTLPGITGLAQIRGIDMSTPKRLARIDQVYIQKRSFMLDLKLILLTAFLRQKT